MFFNLTFNWERDHLKRLNGHIDEIYQQETTSIYLKFLTEIIHTKKIKLFNQYI